MKPAWTVVVPTFNRLEGLKKCVEGIRSQDLNCDFEVIVVNDGGVTPTNLPNSVRVIDQKNAGPAAARNRGAAEARGERLAFLDDDCVPENGWLAALERHITDGALLGGCTVNGVVGNRWSQVSQDVVDCLAAELLRKGGDGQFFASNNIALGAAEFDEVGGFDTSFPLAAGEDRDFCLRVEKSGLQFRKVNQAKVKHFHHLDLRSFLKQHFNYGRGAFQLREVYGDRAKLMSGAGRRFMLYPGQASSRRKMLLAQAATFIGFQTERFS